MKMTWKISPGCFRIQTVSIVDRDENPAENIYRLSDMILIKEKIWQ